jgi:hypothetical protein
MSAEAATSYSQAIATLRNEVLVVVCCARDVLENGPVDWADYCRVVKAMQRIESTAHDLIGRESWSAEG